MNVLALLMNILFSLLGLETWGWLPALTKLLVVIATAAMPAELRRTRREEWLAELEAEYAETRLAGFIWVIALVPVGTWEAVVARRQAFHLRSRLVVRKDRIVLGWNRVSDSPDSMCAPPIFFGIFVAVTTFGVDGNSPFSAIGAMALGTPALALVCMSVLANALRRDKAVRSLASRVGYIDGQTSKIAYTAAAKRYVAARDLRDHENGMSVHSAST
jgi:hypothetical protein